MGGVIIHFFPHKKVTTWRKEAMKAGSHCAPSLPFIYIAMLKHTIKNNYSSSNSYRRFRDVTRVACWRGCIVYGVIRKSHGNYMYRGFFGCSIDTLDKSSCFEGFVRAIFSDGA